MEGGRGFQILRWVIFAFLLLYVAVTLAWHYLPTYAERRLIPGLIEDLTQDRGWGPLSVQVRRLGLRGAELGDLVLGDPQAPAVTADSLRADFNLQDLKRKRIRRLVLSGARLRLRVTDQGVELPGFPFPGPKAADPQTENAPGPLLPPLPLDELQITQSRIEVQWNGHLLRVPLDLRLQTDPANPAQLGGQLRLLPWGRQLSLTGRLQDDPALLTIDFESEPLPLSQIAALIPGGADVRLQGDLTLQGTLSLDPTDLRISTAQVQIGLRDPSGMLGDTPLRLAATEHSHGPIRIQIHYNEGETWRMNGPPLQVVAPLPLELAHWQLSQTGNPEPRGWDLAATLTPNWNQILQPWGAKLPESAILPLKLEASYQPNGSWQARLAAPSAPQIPLTFRESDLTVRLESPTVTVSAQGTESQAAADYQIQLPGCRLNSAGLELQSGKTTLAGRMAWRASDPNNPLTASYRFTTVGPKVNAGGATTHFPQIDIAGEAGVQPNGDIRTQGSLAFSNATLNDPAREIEFRSLSGVLPYRWPLETDMKPGKLTVGKATFQNFDLGRTVLHMQPHGTGMDLKGSITGALLPRMRGKIKGRMGQLPGGGLDGELKVELDLPVTNAEDLGQWFPAGQGHTFQGRIKAELEARLNGAQTAASAKLAIFDGILENQDSEFQVAGIEAGLEIPDLFILRSHPAQRLTFLEANMGRVHLDPSEIVFQIEPGPNLFIEEGRFQWCGGQVFIGPTRIGSDPDLAVDLFCDRLRMAPLMAQIGDFKAEGQGSLNGRIPLLWKDGKLIFEDGFLYSSPGEEGSIQLTGTEILTSALPAGTPQANQVEVAREALKDYNYKWAKLELNSVGEDLSVQMKLDGQPAANLPFVFDQEFGGFVPVGPDEAGSRFQGIRLDVNFSLPLNSLLGHYESIQQFMQSN